MRRRRSTRVGRTPSPFLQQGVRSGQSCRALLRLLGSLPRLLLSMQRDTWDPLGPPGELPRSRWDAMSMAYSGGPRGSARRERLTTTCVPSKSASHVAIAFDVGSGPSLRTTSGRRRSRAPAVARASAVTMVVSAAGRHWGSARTGAPRASAYLPRASGNPFG